MQYIFIPQSVISDIPTGEPGLVRNNPINRHNKLLWSYLPGNSRGSFTIFYDQRCEFVERKIAN
jgi:hypothetical protein